MSAWGAGQGFAQGFATQFAKGLEVKYKEEMDEARVAADRYKMDKDAFLKSEKEDEEKVNQAEQLIESLYPKADKRNKNARTIDALNMLRANISYEQVKKDMEARVYEDLKEEQKTERKDNVVSSDINDQTNELIANADKALNNTGFEGEAKDTSGDTEFKEEEKDESGDNIFQKVGGLFTKEGRAERRDNRLDKRIEGLTGVDAEERARYSAGFTPSKYLEPSNTTFSRKPDKTNMPKSLGALAVENLINSTEFQATEPGSSERAALIKAAEKKDSPPGSLNALATDNVINSKEYQDAPVGSDIRMNLIIEANDSLRSKDDVIGLSDLVIQLQNLDPKDAGYEDKKKDLEGRIEAASKVEIYQDRLETSFGEKPTRIINKKNPGTIEYVRITPKIDGTEVYLNPNNNQQIDMTDYVVITEEMDTEANNIKKRQDVNFDKYNEKVVDTVDAIRMTGQVIDLIDANPLMLTTTGGTIPAVLKGAGLEVIGLLDTVDKLSKSMKEGEKISLAEFETQAGLTNLGLADIDKMLTDALGQGIVDQATAKSLYNAKILLMAFRLGGLEGQSGNALSNKDFERLQMILNPSRDTAVAKSALRDYMVTMIREQDTRAGILNNSPDIIDFKNKYGVGVYMSLGDNPVITLDEMSKSDKYINDEGFQNGWQYVVDYEPGEKLPRSGEIKEQKDAPITVLNQEDLEGSYAKVPPGSKYSYIKDGKVFITTKPQTQE
jgi:hypothetical protein